MTSEAIEVALHSDRPILTDQLRALYDAVDWWPERDTSDLAQILACGSSVGAWDGGQLVGFARAVSDGRFRAYIEDVSVRPEYRHRGVATRVLELLLAQLDHIDVVSLFCVPELGPLYERSGFVARKDVVMHRRVANR